MECIRKVLTNRMNIIMAPNANQLIFTAGFFIKAGSRNETSANNGIAHFLEHMMFKGTTTRTPTALFEELDSIGANYNAATSAQYTYYYIYGNNDNMVQILDIITDIYTNAVFEPDEIAKEKKVIVEEMRLRFDSPMAKLYSEIHKKIFKGTSLAADIIGTVDLIKNFTKQDLIDFRNSLYKPENTVFVVTGNFNLDKMSKSLNVTLGKLENLPNVPITYFNEYTVIMANMKKQSEPYVHITKNVNFQQVYLYLVFPLYDLYTYKFREIDLLTVLLSSGFSSRLGKSLREENGITYASNAYPVPYIDTGLYMIQMALNPDKLIDGIKITMAVLKNIKSIVANKNEMKKIVNVTKNNTIYSLTDPLDMLIYLGLNFLTDRNFNPNINTEFSQIEKVSNKDIVTVAKEIFVRDKINLFIYGNIDSTIDNNIFDL